MGIVMSSLQDLGGLGDVHFRRGKPLRYSMSPFQGLGLVVAMSIEASPNAILCRPYRT